MGWFLKTKLSLYVIYRSTHREREHDFLHNGISVMHGVLLIGTCTEHVIFQSQRGHLQHAYQSLAYHSSNFVVKQNCDNKSPNKKKMYSYSGRQHQVQCGSIWTLDCLSGYANCKNLEVRHKCVKTILHCRLVGFTLVQSIPKHCVMGIVVVAE